MKVIKVETVHEALPEGIRLLQEEGVKRPTRNGIALVAPCPVTTVYSNPLRKCVMWPERDVNIAFLLYESLWMLNGRNDVKSLVRYVKDFCRYSDDNTILHGAYGYRWRKAFGFDQLQLISTRLRSNPQDRRNVLQIWDAKMDLCANSLDIPCNDTVTFQIDHKDKLNMVVFCRSNDIIWGAYFANAFHFGILLEYMARKVEREVGTYSQVSVNYHAYLNTLNPLMELPDRLSAYDRSTISFDPRGRALEMPEEVLIDEYIDEILMQADTGFKLPRIYNADEPWVDTIYFILRAHEAWRTLSGEKRFSEAFGILDLADPTVDWVILMRRWLERRHKASQSPQAGERI